MSRPFSAGSPWGLVHVVTDGACEMCGEKASLGFRFREPLKAPISRFACLAHAGEVAMGTYEASLEAS